jgi:hypothetical protein
MFNFFTKKVLPLCLPSKNINSDPDFIESRGFAWRCVACRGVSWRLARHVSCRDVMWLVVAWRRDVGWCGVSGRVVMWGVVTWCGVSWPCFVCCVACDKSLYSHYHFMRLNIYTKHFCCYIHGTLMSTFHIVNNTHEYFLLRGKQGRGQRPGQ